MAGTQLSFTLPFEGRISYVKFVCVDYRHTSRILLVGAELSSKRRKRSVKLRAGGVSYGPLVTISSILEPATRPRTDQTISSAGGTNGVGVVVSIRTS